MSATVEHWPVCQSCLTVCVKYLPPDGGGVTAWKQDCRCRSTYFARARECTSTEPLVVYPATAGWGAVAVLSLALVLVTAVAVLLIFRYQGLESQVQEACSETGAAAKLDLSSFVPVCLRVK